MNQHFLFKPVIPLPIKMGTRRQASSDGTVPESMARSRTAEPTMKPDMELESEHPESIRTLLTGAFQLSLLPANHRSDQLPGQYSECIGPGHELGQKCAPGKHQAFHLRCSPQRIKPAKLTQQGQPSYERTFIEHGDLSLPKLDSGAAPDQNHRSLRSFSPGE